MRRYRASSVNRLMTWLSVEAGRLGEVKGDDYDAL